MNLGDTFKPFVPSVTLHPTGTCFEDVSLFFIQKIAEKRSLWNDATYLMCHGICLNDDGTRYSHAWIEEGEYAWFSGMLEGERAFVQATKTEFYLRFDVQECTKYTASAAMREARRNDDRPPPWEKKYLELCRDYKPK